MIGFRQVMNMGVAMRQNVPHPTRTMKALRLPLEVPINPRPMITHALFHVK
jgi:hypothetical protein